MCAMNTLSVLKHVINYVSKLILFKINLKSTVQKYYYISEFSIMYVI